MLQMSGSDIVVPGAQRERPVHHELHVGGVRGLFAGHGDLLGDVGRRDDV